MTDNERDAALIRKVLTVHSGADFLADDFPTLEEGQHAWHALARLVAALSAAERESAWQMGAKLEAQMALRSISEALDLPFDQLGTGWTEGALTIVKRIEEIVDEGERGFRERDEARAALSAATTERDEARARAERKEQEFLTMLGASATEYVRAEALSAQLQQAREALERIVSPRSGHLQRDGLREIARAALAAAAPATTLNEPEGADNA